MKNFLLANKRYFVIAIALAAAALIVVFYRSDFVGVRSLFGDKARVISEAPVLRVVDSVTLGGNREVSSTGESIALVSSERVVIAGGKTPKESYLIAKDVAVSWSQDAQLVYIKSMGTVTVEGVSSGWELLFGSKEKNKGYVLAVVNGTVVQKSEVESITRGYALPSDWYDAGEAVKSIQTLPQFKDATISGLTFYYNEDGKRWGYAISSSQGTVSVPVR